MSRNYQPLDPTTKAFRKHVFQQTRHNRKDVFKEQFNRLLDKQEKHYTLLELSELLDKDRTTINNWKQGHTMPSEKSLAKIEEAFHAPNYFKFMDIRQQELASPKHHREMNQYAASYGKTIGISEPFVRFIRENSQLSDRIISSQPTDAILNSFDPRVIHMDLPYQYSTKAGERVYLNEYMINVLRVIQDEVEQFINAKLDEYEPIIEQEYREEKILFMGRCYPDGYFWKKAREINKKLCQSDTVE